MPATEKRELLNMAMERLCYLNHVHSLANTDIWTNTELTSSSAVAYLMRI